MDFAATPPVASAGHSQGVLAVESLRTRGARDVELMVLIQLIGSACTLVARRRGISALGDRPPMVSVTNADPERIRELLDEFATDVRTVQAPALSIRNGRRSSVITGSPEQLARFELYCQQIAEPRTPSARTRFAAVPCSARPSTPVAVEVGFHTPRLADGVDADRPVGGDASASTPGWPMRWPNRSWSVRSTGSRRSTSCTTPARAGSSISVPATS